MISRIEGRGGKMYSFWAMYSLRMSFWSVPADLLHVDPLLLRHRQVHGEGIGAVELIVIEVVTSPEVDALEEDLHVRQRVDRDAALPHLAADMWWSES